VLAADSRVTLTVAKPGPAGLQIFPASFDHATKLLRFKGQQFVGAITYGLGAIGEQKPRTAHSYLPEFEAELANSASGRLGVEAMARRLSEFFLRVFKSEMPSAYSGPDMTFLVAGYDEGEPYGRVFALDVPRSPDPREWHPNEFGAVWGGQKEVPDRLLNGIDKSLLPLIKEHLTLADEQVASLQAFLGPRLATNIPYQFLPLQDCVDLASLMVRATIELQRWMIGIRGVGGAIDIATITRIDGFRAIQEKQVRGERHGNRQEHDERR
jgi:hypothetical protein